MFYFGIIVCSGVGDDFRVIVLGVRNGDCGCFGSREKWSSVFDYCNCNCGGGR